MPKIPHFCPRHISCQKYLTCCLALLPLALLARARGSAIVQDLLYVGEANACLRQHACLVQVDYIHLFTLRDPSQHLLLASRAMAYNPGVAFFIAFHELDPSNQIKCIFFTQKGARCGWDCQPSDNRRAIALHKTIIATSSEAVSLDLLREYVLCNCCRSGRARHRDRIEDIGLLIPLTQRWQEEIRKRAADQSEDTASVPALEENVLIPDSYTTPTTSTPSHTTTFHITAASTSYCQSHDQTFTDINATSTEPVASSSSSRSGSSRPSTTTEFACQTSESQPQYDLRHREANVSIESNSTRTTLVSQAPLSEFRPHKADPFPNDDSVSWKILEPLQDRDFEPGSLYIFNRASSPGHVKIGWTAVSVSGRLRHWSKCGYEPNLLFSVHDVPHAQRVETLTHHELIKEWRRERMCKAPWCRKSHQEWFEVSNERAAEVLDAWARFMKTAKPYDDSQGELRTQWKEVIEMMDEIGEVVTAKKLLELYDASLVEEATVVEKPEDPEHAPAIEELVDFGNRLGVGHLEDPKGALLDQVSPRVQQPTLLGEMPLLESKASPTQIPPEEQPKSSPLSKEEPLQMAEPLFKIEPLPTSQLLSTAEPAFTLEPLQKTGPPPAAESLLETEPPTNSEPIHEEVLAPERTPVEKALSPEQIPLPSSPLLQSTPFLQDTLSSQEIPPEQIPLPPSPPLQSTTFPEDTVSSQEANPIPSTETEESGTPDVIIHSDAYIPVVDTSTGLGIVSSVTPPTPANLSATTPTSAAPSEDYISETNIQPSTYNSIATSSPPLRFIDPSSSQPSSSEPPPTSTSPRPRPKAEQPVSDAPAPLGLVPETSKELLVSPAPSTAEQAEIAETPPPSLTERQQNVEEVSRQAEPTATELLLGSDSDGQTRRDEEITAHEPDESTATTEDHEPGPGAGSEASTDEWDAEETLLVEDQQQQTPTSLEAAVSKIANGLCDEFPTGKTALLLRSDDEKTLNDHHDHHHHHSNHTAPATTTPEPDGKGTNTPASDADADGWDAAAEDDETLVVGIEIQEIQEQDEHNHMQHHQQPTPSSLPKEEASKLILDDVDALCSEFSTLRIGTAEANVLLLKEGLEDGLKTKTMVSESEAPLPPPPAAAGVVVAQA